MNITIRAMNYATDWQWIKERLPVKLVEDTQGIVAEDDGTLVAAVIMDNWTYSSVQIHQVIEKPMILRHNFFEEVARHVFDTCGKHQMIGLVPGDSDNIKRFDEKIGFKEVARIPNGHSVGIDTVVMAMTADQCRFYRSKEAA